MNIKQIKGLKLTGIVLVLLVSTLGLLFGSGCARKQQQGERVSFNVKGSDTMVNLMSNLAEEYMKEHQNVNIAVTGGGSGTGIAALINGTTEVCASSRKISEKEIELAKSKTIHPTELIVGLDGLAVMVKIGRAHV